MIPNWFREKVIETHNNARAHLHFVLQDLTLDELIKEVTSEEYSRSIAGTVMHIGTAETYWFHKAKNPIGPPVIHDTWEEVTARMSENTEKITNIIRECDEEQLRIIPPRDGGPSFAWAALRTSQHGIYHAGQIAKIRRIIGAKELPKDIEGKWGTAVDSLLEILKGFID
ncbi:MAG: DinB family protein [Candidatus Thorarchaeota archaeon]